MCYDSMPRTFEVEVIYYENRFWLVEYCVYWTGQRVIMEMVEIEGNIDDYIEN